MKFEKPQKGNPHRLTIKQHAFPVASISRFTKSDGRVSVYLLKQRKELRLKPDNQIFYAKRVWDQRAESGFMKDIEDKYQDLAEAITDGKIKTLTKNGNQIITDMYALWNIRANRKLNPIPDQQIDIIDVSTRLTKDEQESLEKNNIGYIKPNHTIPGRQITGGKIQLNLFEIRKQMKDIKWEIIRSSKGQFIVPDNFSNVMILPLSPTTCFIARSHNDIINDKDTSIINRLAIKNSNEYYFANDLSKCFK
jgi:hypothetical protein